MSIFKKSNHDISYTPDGNVIISYYFEVGRNELDNSINMIIQEEVRKQMGNAANTYFADMIRKQVKKGLKDDQQG